MASLTLIFNTPPSPLKPCPNLYQFATTSKRLAPSLSKSHIRFALSPSNNSNYDPEEARWLREEQRWFREEQRWLREESRWNAEREALLHQITELKLQIEALERQSGAQGSPSVANLLQALKKEVSQIAEKGSSAVPLVVEAVEREELALAKDVEAAAAEEVVVKEVVSSVSEEVKKRRTTLRVGSEGEEVRAMQERLQSLGFYSGEEDMEFFSFSSGTERAVKTWQASLGVPESGLMTPELLEMLYLELNEGQAGSFPEVSDETSTQKEGANGAVVASVTEILNIEQKIVKESMVAADESEHRVFLLGENRWEDPSRLSGKNRQVAQANNKNAPAKCLTCRGEGRLLCLECDGTGEPNVEPQFLEWVDEEMKCPYCEGRGYTTCDVCDGKSLINVF